jgi:hypothetical protein
LSAPISHQKAGGSAFSLDVLKAHRHARKQDEIEELIIVQNIY